MTTSQPKDPLGHLVAPPTSVDPFLDAKLTSPPNRDSWVQRDRLIEVMDRAARHPVTLVAAPAGYGKTTLVAQWLNGRPGRPRLAVLDSGDNDPDRLWTHVAVALERSGVGLPVSEPARVVGGDPAPKPRALLPAIVAALAAVPDEIVLVLDDFHFIQHRPPRAGPVPDLEPACSGAPRPHHPLGSRTPPGPASRIQRPGRDPRGRPQLHHARSPGAAGKRQRPSLARDGHRTGGAHRGLARRAVPGHAVVGGPTRRRRLRAAVQRPEPVHRRLPDGGGAQPAHRAGQGLHHHGLDPGSVLGAVVRPRRGDQRLRNDPPRARTVQSVRRAARRGPPLVPLPSPLRRCGVERAGADAPGSRAVAPCPGRRVVPLPGARRGGGPALTRRWKHRGGRVAGGGQLVAVRRCRARRDGGRMAGVPGSGCHRHWPRGTCRGCLDHRFRGRRACHSRTLSPPWTTSSTTARSPTARVASSPPWR